MTAVVIENEYRVPAGLQQFITEHLKEFSPVDVQIGCLHRPIHDLAPHIIAADAVLIESTFVHMVQIEEFLRAFLGGPLAVKDYKFFITAVSSYLNRWLTTNKRVAAYAIELMERSEIYEIHLATDGDHMAYEQVHYSPDHNVFYLHSEDPQTIANERSRRYGPDGGASL